jgi:hypothetical protein
VSLIHLKIAEFILYTSSDANRSKKYPELSHHYEMSHTDTRMAFKYANYYNTCRMYIYIISNEIYSIVAGTVSRQLITLSADKLMRMDFDIV